MCARVSVRVQGACGHDCMPIACLCMLKCGCAMNMYVCSDCLGEGRGAEGAVGYIFAKLRVCLWADRSEWFWVWSCLL